MNLRLTDYLMCPRCRSELGLILLADRVAEQRVQEGQLGCPNCRAQFQVHRGVADFQGGDPTVAASVREHDATTLAALMGVTEGPAMVLLIGEWGETPARISALVPDVEVIVHQQSVSGSVGRGVSRLRGGEHIALRDASMRAVVLTGDAPVTVSEAARVCRLAARLVLLGGSDAQVAALSANGLRVLAAQGETVVAVRES